MMRQSSSSPPAENLIKQPINNLDAAQDRAAKSRVATDPAPKAPPAKAPAAKASAPGNALIALRGANKTYGNGSHALIDLNLEIRRGDFLFITGPSGSGKSTLLKLLYGEETTTSGEVMVDGFQVGDLKGDRLAELRRRIGIVFQDYKLIARRTVAENIAFVLQAQGYSRQEVQRRLTPALKMVGLIHKADSFPDQLSGGEQQRVCIARAIVSTPPLLLADEPTGNLDADNSWQVIKILNKLNAIGITVIVTTHDESLIRMSGHPVVQLRNGRLYKAT
jgi:cell division transport system ATP-binding protein